MNYKKIVFSGIITALLGAGIGWVISRAFPSPYTAEIYRGLDRKYLVVGSTIGLLFGCSQEALRQLKQQQEMQGKSSNTKGIKPDRQRLNQK